MNFNATFFGQLIAFAVFIWFCMQFIWPLLLKTIEDRQKRIADGLAAGEQGERKLVEAEQRYQAMVDEGKQKAVHIIDQAKRRAEELVEEAKKQAKKEGEYQLSAVKSEISREQEQARQELRKQVSILAVAGAKQILMREVDQAAHEGILSKISAEL